jgi:hypothetical protein
MFAYLWRLLNNTATKVMAKIKSRGSAEEGGSEDFACDTKLPRSEWPISWQAALADTPDLGREQDRAKNMVTEGSIPSSCLSVTTDAALADGQSHN